MILNDMNPYKVLGSDGFLTFSFEIFCYCVKDEVMQAVQYFFSSGMLLNSWNQTYITLIPKKKNSSHPNAFRSISLCNSIHKLAAKILVK